jgi:2-C-methyl-D-erythritol 4-phosphate cytidylyltransferase 1
MNVAIIFAGGTGQRMSSSGIPKQFLLVNQKPIIVHTLEHFQYAPNIDKIIVVSLASGIPQVESLVAKFGLTKVVSIIPGGSTGQESIFHGLEECRRLFDDETVVLLHDGVRPIINETMIEECISCVLHHGNAITVAPSTETTFVKGDEPHTAGKILDRSQCVIAKAPQCFFLGDIHKAHLKANEEKLEFIDSASMMQHFGHTLYLVEGLPANIKITTPIDFYTFKAYLDVQDSMNVIGL